MVRIGRCVLNGEKTRVALSLMGKDQEDLDQGLDRILEVRDQVDLVEFRADFFGGLEDPGALEATLCHMGKGLEGLPLIFSLRSQEEGGLFTGGQEAYLALNRQVIEGGLVQAVDLEYRWDKKALGDLVALAKKRDLPLILSTHNFLGTPEKEVIRRQIQAMVDLGGQVIKLAYHARTPREVLTLMEGVLEAKEAYKDRAFIAISMGELGRISRLAGQTFGSEVTFAKLGRASGPGQVDLGQVRQVLDLLEGEA
ncbi:MAG: type I 3-dehydroquinate dehydratase [Tissierellia bacterium]|nr:type I 3-dehydroquinate dehydratase [Tissierellia bacterium]